MSNLFHKAIQCQKNLDKIYPDRYWPVGAESPPKPHIIKVTKMYAQGVRPRDIVKQLGMSKPMVISIIKRSRFHQDTKYRAKHN